jgi:eukaryotic-like serine/threonine-protein kinase
MSSPTPDPPLPQDADLEPGQLIGEYEIESTVGHGGFGTVFKAVHPLIGKVVAIKVLSRQYSADPEMVARFIDEARAVNQIHSRYIIDIFSFGQLPDGRHYYVMEYLEGEPLDTTIARRGHVTLADALPILRGIAKALDAAHGKGIAHRDLKPENVFIVRDQDGDDAGRPKLLDFGIAKLMGELDGTKHKTRTGIPIGTPYYMSPEQCRGKDVDHRTDYYAFGVVAYQLLTGVHPIDGDDYMEIMMRQLTLQPTPASTLVPELSAGIDAAIAWLMEKDRELRPPNLAAAMHAFDLAAVASGLSVPTPTGLVDVPMVAEVRARLATPGPISATSPGAPSTGLARTLPSGAQLEPSRRRWPLIAGAIAMVAVLGFVAVVTLGSLGGRGPHAQVAPQPSAPSPAPTPPTHQQLPAAPTTAIVSVTGVPDGTEVSIAGAVIGVAPGPVQVAHGASEVVLTFKASGYLPAARTITPDRDQTLALELHKRAAPPGVRHDNRADKDSILDPFGKAKP